MTPADRSRRRHLAFDVAILALAGACLVALYMARILPLSTPPAGPPDGLSLAWAGDPLREGQYAETLTIHATDCTRPVTVELDLFGGGASTQPGRVALAFAGAAASLPRDLRVYLSPANASTAPQLIYGGPLARSVVRPPVTTTSEGGGDWSKTTYAFTVDLRKDPLIDVLFTADWQSSRTRDDTCWLNVPKLIGSFDDAALTANRAANLPSAYGGTAFGYPLTHANVILLNDGDAAVGLDSGGSIPIPSSLDPASWTCDTSDHTRETNCQTFALLEKPGTSESRTRSLTIWSVLAGLLLAVFGDAAIAVLRVLVVRDAGRASA